ncbi:NtaA/DmoA family FMN-dependent monooxygenase [Poseidonocella sp. HB161398]|uniref:NtaA/DmoA family FMN-dependent monooxygenase n=1 Tax=Poseidonocella sp. HB161398 TaxID=2320855 RepID=UPI0011090702|nr:NtaA/DmoA family FMN-dependent monooxygenase [Poseidonocella sp. HB161398]
MAAQLHIGMSLSPTWLSGEGWRRPDSGVEGLYGADFALDVARRAEAAHLDFVFRPDTLYLDRAMVETGPGFGALDPTLLMAALARETAHIGLLTTVSTTFWPPYVVARQLQSLNWLSGGRAGWNIVTALDGQRNFGMEAMPDAAARYARAEEFVDLVKKLWASYPAEALLADRGTGRYGDAALVQPVSHRGESFAVEGPLNLPDPGYGPMPLVQAGASERGRDFAAAVADAIFASSPDRGVAADLRADLRARAVRQGRAADAIRVLPGLSLYLAGSRAEARDLHAATYARVNRARKLASVREMTGLDLESWPGDRPITAADLPPMPAAPRSRTHAELLRRMILREAPTPDELMTRPEVMASGHWQIVGTPAEAADEIAAWHAAGAIDGVVLLPGGSAGSMHLSLEALVPELAGRGLFRQGYSGRSFRGHLEESRKPEAA